jgi:hypothetical protein
MHFFLLFSHVSSNIFICVSFVSFFLSFLLILFEFCLFYLSLSYLTLKFIFISLYFLSLCFYFLIFDHCHCVTCSNLKKMQHSISFDSLILFSWPDNIIFSSLFCSHCLLSKMAEYGLEDKNKMLI